VNTHQGFQERAHDSLRVLLVEDDPVSAHLVSDIARAGAPLPLNLTRVSCLEEVFEHLRTEPVDVILLDLVLPDSDGVETFTRTCAAAPHVPIVVLTSIDDAQVAARALREGAEDYLVKGHIDAAILQRSIRYAIERHEAYRALRATEEQFRQLADNVKEAIVIVDLPDHPVFVSRAWQDIWGRDVADVCHDPKAWFEAVHRDDRDAVAEARRAVARGESAIADFRVVRPDGSLRWVRARFFPVRDSEERVVRSVGLIEDTTEMRRTEDQLRQAQKMEAIGRLAGGIAHDFNNLLVAILGYSDLALSDLGAQHRSAEDLRQIRAAAKSAGSLTRQLLAFSRRQVLQPHVIDLNHVLRRVEPLLRRLITEDIALTMTLATPLARVTADPGQIEQVIVNLAVNARDAMPHGGQLSIETLNVDLDEQYAAGHAGAAAGRHVMLGVSDTGTGMDEATQKRLFEPFFTTKEPGHGTGLGLATVYGIIKQSQGSIWVYSEPGHGSTFKIYLPATTTQAEVDPAVASEVNLSGSETVLLVEDQDEPRSAIREILRRHGYTVLEAGSGPEAIGLSRRADAAIHVLLTDVVVPGMSGRQIGERLHEERLGLRVIYMSGYTDDAIVRHGMLEGGDVFLQKPFTADALLRTIRRVLDADDTKSL
jgi:two-component system, cell cycle sensor histidine kinase and response regulator CckA